MHSFSLVEAQLFPIHSVSYKQKIDRNTKMCKLVVYISIKQYNPNRKNIWPKKMFKLLNVII